MNASDFDAAVRAVKSDILGVGLVKRKHSVASPATFFPRSDGTFVRVDWKDAEPTASVKEAVRVAIERAQPVVSRLDALRAKRRAGQVLTAAEQQELMDLLLGV